MVIMPNHAIYNQVIQRESWEHIKDEDIRKAAASFMGEIWQVPPMFSAIKVHYILVYAEAIVYALYVVVYLILLLVLDFLTFYFVWMNVFKTWMVCTTCHTAL